jgi:hypothetical protein
MKQDMVSALRGREVTLSPPKPAPKRELTLIEGRGPSLRVGRIGRNLTQELSFGGE